MGEIRHYIVKTNFKSLNMLFQETEHHTQLHLELYQVGYFEKTVKIKKSNLFNYFV